MLPSETPRARTHHHGLTQKNVNARLQRGLNGERGIRTQYCVQAFGKSNSRLQNVVRLIFIFRASNAAQYRFNLALLVFSIEYVHSFGDRFLSR